MKSYVWAGMLYGCENWTIRQSALLRRRLETLEMWLLLRRLRIPLTARSTNKQVLQMLRTSRSLLTTIRQRELRYLGHVLRASSLEKDCLLGMIEGKKAGGRQRMKLMGDVKEITGCKSNGEIIRTAEDRSKWRNIVANVNIQDTAHR